MSDDHAIRGGDYISEQGPDGKWTIRGVPIFAEHRRQFGKDGPESVWTREDLDAAIRYSADRKRETGHMPRLHVHHHSLLKEPTAVGFFMPTRVVEMALGGKVRAVVLADLVGIPNHAYQAIKNLELPYRSVETYDKKPRRILSLALLPTEAPFFELPMLTIGREKPHPAAAEPVLAYGTSRESTHLLFGFKPMPDPAPSEKPEETPAEKPATSGPSATEAASFALLGKIYELLQQLASAREDTERQNANKPKVVQMGADGKPLAPEATPYSAELATAKGELAGLHSRLSKIESEKKRDVAIKAAVDSLKGYETDRPHQVLCTEAYDTLGGEDGLKFFVEGLKKNIQPDPDGAWADGEVPGAPKTPDVPEVAKFAAEGPEMLAFARSVKGAYDAMPEFFRTSMPFERFIEAQKRGRPQAAANA